MSTSHTLYRRPRGAKRGTRWERIGKFSYPLATARRVFQNALIANSTRELDPDHEYQLRKA